MSKDLISVPVQVAHFVPLKDRSWKITFETRELTGEEVKLLADNYQGEGWMLFKPNTVPIEENLVPKTDADAGVRTQSQRLRAKIMVWWHQTGRRGDPESFYRTKMESLLEFVDSKLEKE